MKKLAVNGLRLAGPRTAMGRYIEWMLHFWSRTATAFDRIEVCVPRSVQWTGLDIGEVTEVTVRRAPAMPLAAWEQVWLPRVTRTAAVLFCPAYTAPLLRGGRLVVANHGIYEALPSEFSWWRRVRTVPLFRASARRADRVIANSTWTRDDLVRFFGIAPEKIGVIAPAASELFFETTRESSAGVARDLLGTSAPFVLFVGKLSRRRHVPELIAAFADTRARAALPHRLVIVGPNPEHLDIMEAATRWGVGANVVHIPFLEQHALAALYAACDLFVLPTTYEGTSWTILEAMASGAPVLTVEHPQLAGGVAEAVCVVPQPDPRLLAQEMTRLLLDASARENLSLRGRLYARCFSWAGAARATLSVIEEVAFR